MEDRRHGGMRDFTRFLGMLRPYRWRIIQALLCMLASSLLSLPMPMIMRYLIDEVIGKTQWGRLNIVFFLIVGLYILSGIVSFLLTMIITYLGQRVIFDIRSRLYKHLQKLSLSYFEKRQTGKIISRVINDVNVIQALITSGFITTVSDIVTLVIVLFILFYQDWMLAALALSVFPIYIFNFKFFIARIRGLSWQIREKMDIIFGDLQEKLSGIQVVKTYAREKAEIRQFVGETRDSLDLNVRQGVLGTELWTIAEFIGAVGTALVLWFGGRQVIQGHLTTGQLIAFYSYVGYLYGPTLRLIQINDTIQRTLAAIHRIFETLDTPPDIADKPGAVDMPPIQGRVRFENLVFGYNPDRMVLHNINLEAEPGMIVAFVGQSGSGKTTMINLIPRHYDPVEGRVTIDGFDLRDVRLSSLRRQIGVVIQETILFNTTIMENIRYGKLDASDEEVHEAARAANIHHVIEQFPLGYETKLGEEGVKLSGGERQRLAIARALLAQPRILILDEATSALDSETEAQIQEALDRLMQGRTSFVIAHRLSTIINADKIVVMEKGNILEAGNHQELLALGGTYAGLYNQQFKSALEAAEA
ncbi:MAG: ABC transporter ATP-binding protein [Armatimonadetes bacterium]|nr:ABC transporter ATP-binding protein [Armatimonadota bacterium]